MQTSCDSSLEKKTPLLCLGGFWTKPNLSCPKVLSLLGFNSFAWGILSDKTPSPDFWSTSYFLKCISVHHQICPFWYEFKIQSSTCHKTDTPHTHAAPWLSVVLHYVKNYPFFCIQTSSSCSLFCFFYRYFIMQSCWAFDSRKRPSFSNLTSCLGCQLADAEEAVCGSTALSQVGLYIKGQWEHSLWVS